MPIYPDDSFTNPEILVGTPPPFDRDNPQQEYAEWFWYGIMALGRLDKDSCSDLFDLVQKSAGCFSRALIRTLRDEDDPWADGNDPFNYKNNDLIMGDPGNLQLGAPLPAKTKPFKGYPTFLQVPNTLALMSMPFYSPLFFCRNNGLIEAQYRNKDRTVYEWTTDSQESLDACKVVAAGDYSHLNISMRTDGESIRLELRTKQAENDSAFLPEFMRNQEIGAFTLFLSVTPKDGVKVPMPGQDNQGQENQGDIKPWEVSIDFGDILAIIKGGDTSMRVLMTGTGNDDGIFTVPLNYNSVMLDKKTASLNNYGITFIPVWNGLLVSDQLINLNNAADQVAAFATSYTYLPKQSARNVYTDMTGLMNEFMNEEPPRFGPNGENRADATAEMLDDKDVRVDTGNQLIVTFSDCGGTLRFAPVWFVPASRCHVLMQGERNEGSVDSQDNECGTDTRMFDLNPVTDYRMVPLVHFDGASLAVVEKGIVNLTSGSNPVWSGSLEVVNAAALRRPAEVWGFYLYGAQPPLTEDAQYRRADGTLNEWDVPQDRIQTVSINRSLDGSGGTLQWDLYDAVDGTTYRPPQGVGGIRIGAQGGNDTRPGVIFTGIGFGNGEADTPDSNVVTIPLKGREVKASESEKGIRLINSPFFDGFDHRDVLLWLATYMGVPFQTYASAYKLPTGSIQAPVYNFRSNTTVWEAIQKVAGDAMTVVYFDRFGVLTQRDCGKPSDNDWQYSGTQLLSYSDEPDLAGIANSILVAGLVTTGPVDLKKIMQDGFPRDGSVQLRLAMHRADTNPSFAWDKMEFHVINGTLTPQAFALASARIVFGLTRARATGQVVVPGNADIELLDTFNGGWVITTINHTINLGKQKDWRTTLGLELFVGVPSNRQSGLPNNFAAAGPNVAQPAVAKLAVHGSNPLNGEGVDMTVDPTPGFGGFH